MASSDNKWPTAIIVVAAILLIGPIIWALSLVMNVIAAAGIGIVIVGVLIVLAFMWFKRRVDAQR